MGQLRQSVLSDVHTWWSAGWQGLANSTAPHCFPNSTGVAADRPAVDWCQQSMSAPQPYLVDEHLVILGGLLFFLAMAIVAALGFQP